MSNLKRLLVSTTILIGLLLAACGGGDSGDGSGSESGGTPPTSAVSIALPETGQTTCTDATGVVIACAGTGQDGEHQAGVAWPNPRFSVDSSGDCMTDNLTGLMWVRSPDTTVRTWQQALDFANSLDLCGATDWRLPNVNELESQMSSEAADQASFLNGHGSATFRQAPTGRRRTTSAPVAWI